MKLNSYIQVYYVHEDVNLKLYDTCNTYYLNREKNDGRLSVIEKEKQNIN